MAKKKLEKLKSGKVRQQTKRSSKNDPPARETSKPFEFGGIPDRSLKKNLGC
jgi:hypothetical protein